MAHLAGSRVVGRLDVMVTHWVSEADLVVEEAVLVEVVTEICYWQNQH